MKNILDEIMLSQFYQNPRLLNVYNPNTTKLMFGDQDRTNKAQMYGSGRLEYWPKNEEGIPQFPHPAPGNTALEVYDSKLKQNPELLNQAVYGDLLHGMKNDPLFNELRNQFKSNFHPKTLDFELSQGRNKMDDSRLDEYIRGYLSPDENAEFMKAYYAGHPVYTPKQIDILEMMKTYLSGDF